MSVRPPASEGVRHFQAAASRVMVSTAATAHRRREKLEGSHVCTTRQPNVALRRACFSEARKILAAFRNANPAGDAAVLSRNAVCAVHRGMRNAMRSNAVIEQWTGLVEERRQAERESQLTTASFAPGPPKVEVLSGSAEACPTVEPTLSSLVGDLLHHVNWSQSCEQEIQNLVQITKQLDAAFARLQDTSRHLDGLCGALGSDLERDVRMARDLLSRLALLDLGSSAASSGPNPAKQLLEKVDQALATRARVPQLREDSGIREVLAQHRQATNNEYATEDAAACSSQSTPPVQARGLPAAQLSDSLAQPPINRPTEPPPRSSTGPRAAETLQQPSPALLGLAGTPPTKADGLIDQTSSGEAATVTEYILRVERSIHRMPTLESQPAPLDVLPFESVGTPEADVIQDVSKRRSMSPQPSTVCALVDDDSGASVVTGIEKCVGASLLDGEPGSEERQFASTSAGSEERLTGERLTTSTSAWRSETSDTCDEWPLSWRKLPTSQFDFFQPQRRSVELKPMTAAPASEGRRRMSAPSVDTQSFIEAPSGATRAVERQGPSSLEWARRRSADLRPMTLEAVFEARRRQSAPSLDLGSSPVGDSGSTFCTDEDLVQRATMRLSPARPSAKPSPRRHSLGMRMTLPPFGVSSSDASPSTGTMLDHGVEPTYPPSAQTPRPPRRVLPPMPTSRLRS